MACKRVCCWIKLWFKGKLEKRPSLPVISPSDIGAARSVKCLLINSRLWRRALILLFKKKKSYGSKIAFLWCDPFIQTYIWVKLIPNIFIHNSMTNEFTPTCFPTFLQLWRWNVLNCFWEIESNAISIPFEVKTCRNVGNPQEKILKIHPSKKWEGTSLRRFRCFKVNSKPDLRLKVEKKSAQ